jgi:hypothetical protein
VRLLQPWELVDPPPFPTPSASAVIRALLLGREGFVSEWLKRNPTLIREQCLITGMTPLLAVIWSSALPQAARMRLTQWLILQGADLGARDWQGRCAFQLAYLPRQDTAVVALLLERGARPIPFFQKGLQTTLLSVALLFGHTEVVRLFLERHAKSGLFVAAELDQALRAALLLGRGTAAELLIQSGAKVKDASYHLGAASSLKLIPPLQVLRGRLHDSWRSEFERYDPAYDEIGTTTGVAFRTPDRNFRCFARSPPVARPLAQPLSCCPSSSNYGRLEELRPCSAWVEDSSAYCSSYPWYTPSQYLKCT